ncbi:MAG: Nif3-like dinuclear metal center hexameric protein [Alistipes sp.]|nr:Nif3-like dinuclear metal center hexameric protein [Alistipes sp.]
MKIKDITACIEQFAPLTLQESYDNAGLVVGRADDELRGGVLIAVDVTPQVLDEAERLGCGLIVTHHPLIFHPLKRLNSASMVERCVEMAIKRDIALYACHTNLDSAYEGMSWRLGRVLGVQDMQVLEPSSEMTGFGVVGTLAEPLSVEALFDLLRERLSVKVIRHSALVRESIRRVAICTGAGGSCMEAARGAGCDIYITADLRYNDFFAPDGEFIVADIGHFESEFCAIDILFDILSKKITNFALHKSACSKNPVHYSL